MSNILVTGGAGYIGSHTVSELIGAGHRVIVYDNLIYGHRESVHPKAKFIQGDILDSEKLSSVFNLHEIDSVIHFAAFAYVGESVENPSKYYFNNLSGGVSLLNAMAKANIRRIVFSSSCAVYGEPQKIPITENEKKSPINPYGKSKLFFESMLEDYERAYGIKSVSLRYFNASGASLDGSNGENHNPETHLIPLAIKATIDPKFRLKVFGNDYKTEDGTCIRDYVHVLDIADAHIRALNYLENPSNKSLQLNLGSEKGYSIMQIIKEIEKISKKKVKYDIVKRRGGDPAVLIADSSKIRKVLQWNPKYSDLKTIIETAWQWHSNHK